MMTLAGKFAGILLAEVPEERADSFLRVLESLEIGGMEIVAQRFDAPARPEGTRESWCPTICRWSNSATRWRTWPTS